MTTPSPAVAAVPPDPLPTEPIPSSPPPAPAPVSRHPRSSTAALDAFLTHLNATLQTPTGIDTVLQFICYTSRLSAAVLTTTARSTLQSSPLSLLALTFATSPQGGGRAALITTGSNKGVLSSAAAAGGLVLAQRLKALSTLLSEARMMLRLWGLLKMYFWGRKLVATQVQRWRSEGSSSGEKSPGKSTLADANSAATVVEWTQLVTCVVFQALENGAYLSAKGVLGWTPAQQARAGRWSSRFWGVFVGTELGRLAFELAYKEVRTEEEKGEAATLRSAVVRNMAWAPLSVHWGVEGGLVSETLVGLLASVPATIQMRDLWRSTAMKT